MKKTMKSPIVLVIISGLALAVVGSYVYLQYSRPVSNQTKSTVQQEPQLWTELQRQQLQIEHLNQKIANLHSELDKLQRTPPITTQKQSQASALEQLNQKIAHLHSELDKLKRQQPLPTQTQSLPMALKQKQRQLFESYNKIPVKVYANSYRNKTWTKVPELCQNLSGFQSTKLHTLSGVLDIYIHDPKKDKWVSGALANGNIWESALVNLILTTLKKEKDAVFIDIGANLGVYSLFAAKQGADVISIEPLMVNVQRMCTSVRAGHLSDKLTIIRGALSDVSQNVSLGIDINNVGGSFVVQNQNENKVKASRVGGRYSDVVMSATLDELLDLPDFKFARAVIKIDVEGYEHKVVRGGADFFNRVAVPTILMEWVFHKGAESGTEIINFFGSRNYTAYDPLNNAVLDYKLSKSWPHEIVWRNKV